MELFNIAKNYWGGRDEGWEGCSSCAKLASGIYIKGFLWPHYSSSQASIDSPSSLKASGSYFHFEPTPHNLSVWRASSHSLPFSLGHSFPPRVRITHSIHRMTADFSQTITLACQFNTCQLPWVTFYCFSFIVTWKIILQDSTEQHPTVHSIRAEIRNELVLRLYQLTLCDHGAFIFRTLLTEGSRIRLPLFRKASLGDPRLQTILIHVSSSQ